MGEIRRPTARERLNARIQDALVSHAEQIVAVMADGSVAVLFSDCEVDGFPRSGVCSLDDAMRDSLTSDTTNPCDLVTRRWLEHPREHVSRVLLFIDRGSLLLNIGPEDGDLWIEPDSTDGKTN